MRRKTTPVTVQQWIDSLPVTSLKPPPPQHQQSTDSGSGIVDIRYSIVKGFLMRDASIQSDDASICSSVESVLELRKPDPEAVLLGLGFGPPKSLDYVARIPRRFLQPSKVDGIDIGKFLHEQEQLRSFENQLNHPHFTNCLPIRSSPVSPTHTCDTSQNISKKNSI